MLRRTAGNVHSTPSTLFNKKISGRKFRSLPATILQALMIKMKFVETQSARLRVSDASPAEPTRARKFRKRDQ